ncbi:MAG: cobalamin B12-binding domain-containing protein [Rhizobiales bacterium]|nr:cobalamin B12-binding domain-containing protein [Hyphomicrobiales bacterium]
MQRAGTARAADAAPHEQHTFGLFMIGEFMRRAGWDAWTGPLPPNQELKTLIATGEFSVVGLSASSNGRLAPLAKTIAMVRRLSRDRPLCVMVGGALFAADPGLVAEVGADGTAADARQAIILARGLLDRQTDKS